MAMIINAESLTHLKTLEDNTFDSCVTDPPYHLASIVKRFGSGQKGINNQDENKKIMRRKSLTKKKAEEIITCLLYTSPSPRDRTRSRMPSSA